MYNPFVTAISRNKISAPMRYLLNKNLLHGHMLDYGAGRGFDVEYLELYDYDIAAYDKYNTIFNDDSLLYHFYHIVTCHYVFNVIRDWDEFYNALDEIRDISRTCYISVRSDFKAIKPNWEYQEFYEGFWTGKSFQRFYTKEKVIEHFGSESEILVANTNFILFKLEGHK